MLGILISRDIQYYGINSFCISLFPTEQNSLNLNHVSNFDGVVNKQSSLIQLIASPNKLQILKFELQLSVLYLGSMTVLLTGAKVDQLTYTIVLNTYTPTLL